MRPLYHPPLSEITVEGILYALSDPVRAKIYAQLMNAEATTKCAALLGCKDAPQMPKSTLSQHIKILREAGLIRSERQGVEVHNRTRCDELGKKFGPLVTEIIKAYRQQL